jgi:RNA polymerase sigma factor (sigma-70 family)
MAGKQLESVVGHLHRLGVVSPAEVLTDRQLLQHYTDRRDEQAFALLVRRHAALVLGVCRRILRQTKDAEDVFQATFLVLARKAATTRWQPSVSNWLYTVASRLAREARGRTLCRYRRERLVAEMPDIPAPTLTAMQELCAVLDEELRRLPERYRQPLLLCYLEGQTRDQAARQLGWSLRTLHRRLERGRDLLRARLTGRGLTLSAALLAAALSQQATSATASAFLVCSTVRAALGPAANEGMPASVALLVESGLRGVSAARMNFGMLLLLAISCVAGAGLLAHQVSSVEAPPAPETPRLANTGTEPPRTDREGVPLPPGAIARLGTTRLRPSASELAFRDERTLITCGSNRVVRFWDVATGTMKKVRSLPEGISNKVILSRDGKRLALLEGEGTMGVSVWDVDSGKRLHLLPYFAGQIYRQAAFSPDGRMLATADFSGTHAIRLWDLTTGKGKLLGKATDFVYLMAFSPDGKRLVLDLQDGPIVCWDVADGKELWKRTQMPRGMGFSPDGRMLAVGDPRDPAHVRLIDTASGKSLDEHKFPGIRGVYRVQFSPDHKTLAIGTDKGIALWDLAAGKQRHFLDRASFTFAFAPDGKSLISLGAVLQRWDVATGKPLYEDTGKLGHTHLVQMISWSPDGQRLVSTEGGNDAPVYVWSAREGRFLRTVQPRPGSEWPGWRFTAFTPDGKYLLCGSDQLIRVTDAATGREVRAWPTFDPARKEEACWLANCRLSRDGKTVSAITQGLNARQAAWLKTWDVATGERSLSRSLALRGPSQSAISPDGNSILTNSGILYDVKADKARYQLAAEEPTRIGSPHGFVYSPDGDSIIAAVLQDVPLGQGLPEVKGIQFWQTAIGKPRMRLPVHEFCHSAFSPDGRFLATLSGESIRLWEIVSGKEVYHLPIPGRLVGMGVQMVFAPDGRSLAIGLDDTTIVIWDMMPAARAASRPLSAEPQDRLWAALAGDDATAAYTALGQLIAQPSEALPLLRARLRPPTALPAERVQGLLKDLDSANFEQREASSRQLAELGERAEPALRAARDKNPSLELRRRIDHLLSLLSPEFVRAPETLRGIRAVCVLEQINTPESRTILENLATSGSTTRLAREAETALRRMTGRYTDPEP